MKRALALLLLLAMLLSLCFSLASCKDKTPPEAPSYLDDFDYSTVPSALLRQKVAEIPKYYAVLCSQASITTLNVVLAQIQHLTSPVNPVEEARLAARLDDAVKGLENRVCDVDRVCIFSPQEFSTFEARDTYVDAEVHVLFKNGTDTKLESNTGARIKLHGNSTLDAEKKSLTVKLSKKENLFGFGKSKTWFLISNSFDKSLMRNALCYNFAATAGLSDSVQCEFVEVWYNNTYIGCYLATEKAESGEGRLPIDEALGDYLIEYESDRYEAGTSYVYSPRLGLRFALIEPEEPTGEQLTALRTSLASLEDAILSGNRETLAAVCDVDSFINFYVTSELFKTIDFAFSSTKFYCQSGVWHAGPVWDYDLSAGNVIVNPEAKYREYNNAVVKGESYGDGSGKSEHGIWCNEIWFKTLLEQSWFSDAVKARYLELQPQIENLYKKNDLGASRIDDMLAAYGNAFDRNYTQAGWSLQRESVGRNTDGTFVGSVNYLRDWLKGRNEWLLAHWGLK